MTAHRQQLGAFGERVAVHRLEASGMTIAERNVRVPSGEIDIVARDGDDVVFVEVRTRRADPGTAAESIAPRKLRRMWRCAMEYCEQRAIDPETVRIDLVSIDLGPAGQPALVEHFRALEVPDEE
ncbi:MAG: YraN family protein [Dehalococcoidia bacterium]